MFLLTEEQLALRAEIKAFVDKEIIPAAAELDRSGEYPRALVERVSELGYCAIPFDKALGGWGRSAIDGLIFMEELSRGMGSLGLIFTSSIFQCCYALRTAPSEKQKKDWLIPAIAGKKIICLALSEESGGSDALGIDTIATRQDDCWLLNGSKAWITNAGVADGYIVGARTSAGSRNRDVSVFYVDAHSPGLDDSERQYMVGLNNSPTGKVAFNNCRVPLDSIIGREGDGYRVIKTALNTGRLAFSAVAIGLAQAAMESAVKYTSRRGSFGRMVSSHQGVAFPVAEMYTNITTARNMLYHAADLTDSGRPSTLETAALKLFSTEMCQKVCQNAAQLQGGMGYSRGGDMERILRDSHLLTTAVGTSQICKVIISNAVYNSLPGENS